MRVNPEYLDIENLYNVFENFITERNLDKAKMLNSENLSHLWEQQIYRQIGNYFKKNNLNLEKAFNLIDTDSSGYISQDEFRKMIEIVNIGLNEKDIQNLLK